MKKYSWADLLSSSAVAVSTVGCLSALRNGACGWAILQATLALINLAFIIWL